MEKSNNSPSTKSILQSVYRLTSFNNIMLVFS